MDQHRQLHVQGHRWKWHHDLALDVFCKHFPKKTRDIPPPNASHDEPCFRNTEREILPPSLSNKQKAVPVKRMSCASRQQWKHNNFLCKQSCLGFKVFTEGGEVGGASGGHLVHSPAQDEPRLCLFLQRSLLKNNHFFQIWSPIRIFKRSINHCV